MFKKGSIRFMLKYKMLKRWIIDLVGRDGKACFTWANLSSIVDAVEL